MDHARGLPLTMIVITLLVGCASNGKDDASMDGTADASQRVYESPDEDAVRDLMRAKVDRNESILYGLVHGNFHAVEQAANDLVMLSNRGDWLVHDTKAYMGFSNQFQNAASDLAMGAHNENLDSATNAYVSVLKSCIACHDYLRREDLIKDMPGAVSSANPYHSQGACE